MTRGTDETEAGLGQTRLGRLNGPARGRGRDTVNPLPSDPCHMGLSVDRTDVRLRGGLGLDEFYVRGDHVHHRLDTTLGCRRIGGVYLMKILVKDDLHGKDYIQKSQTDQTGTAKGLGFHSHTRFY